MNNGKETRPTLTPKDVNSLKREQIPQVVFDTLDRLIARNFSEESSTVSQTELVNILEESGLNRKEIFDKNWLDIEDLYRENGWSVVYDKPGYDETYDPTFTFKPSRKRK